MEALIFIPEAYVVSIVFVIFALGFTCLFVGMAISAYRNGDVESFKKDLQDLLHGNFHGHASR